MKLYTLMLKDDHIGYYLNRFVYNKGYKPVFSEGKSNALWVTRERAEEVAEQVGWEDCIMIEAETEY